MKSVQLLRAEPHHAPEIWNILQQAIERRKLDGSQQWQDGYPNPETIKNDIENGFGYVLLSENNVAGYAAIILNNEPAYEELQGKWLTTEDFLVVHRVAISNDFLGQGLAKKIFKEIEQLALQQQICSIKVDTNFDNAAMLHLLHSLHYQYCGEVFFRGSARKAFEKVLRF